MGKRATELEIEYDNLEDVVIIEGVRYSGELFRSLSERGGFETNVRFFFVRHEDGTFNICKDAEQNGVRVGFHKRDTKERGLGY